MSSASIDQQLQAGVAAARQGDVEQARQLLMDVVVKDEANERAWLWLSSVVESIDDRRICLENVLHLNPESLPARRGLARLAQSAGNVAGQTVSGNDYIVRRETAPVSPAAAVLYPERQMHEQLLRVEDLPAAAPAVVYQDRSRYDDIWEKEIDICAYCAAPVAYDAETCAGCRRKLTRSHFSYPDASSDSLVFVVLLISVGQLYFIRALIDVIGQLPLYVAIWHGILFLVLFALAAGAYLRQVWAYYGSLAFLTLATGVMLVDMISGSALTSAAETVTGIDFFLALAENPFLRLAEPVLDLLPPFQLIGMILALLFGILKVYPDFAREQFRLVATVDKGLRDATQFYTAGKEFARHEMWASAVLCWQRAAAHDPTRPTYQQALAGAYGRLGFYARSLDAYRSAIGLTSNDDTRRQLEAAAASVEQNSQRPVVG
jgi:hypothetical protein